jgi:hypothetical protein
MHRSGESRYLYVRLWAIDILRVGRLYEFHIMLRKLRDSPFLSPSADANYRDSLCEAFCMLVAKSKSSLAA